MMFISNRAVGLLVYALLLVGCSAAEAPEVNSEVSSTSGVNASEGAASQTDGAPPATIADLFPDDPAKDLVMSNCTGCHAVACSTIGQRTPARWNALREGHQDNVPSLSEEDRGSIFSYLSANFNDSQPEPIVPPHFLAAGCTPF